MRGGNRGRLRASRQIGAGRKDQIRPDQTRSDRAERDGPRRGRLVAKADANANAAAMTVGDGGRWTADSELR